MADFKSIRRQRTLGAPPPLEEASLNLDAPEVAPFSSPVPTPTKRGEGGHDKHAPRSRRA
jgi:hypothetical protein